MAMSTQVPTKQLVNLLRQSDRRIYHTSRFPGTVAGVAISGDYEDLNALVRAIGRSRRKRTACPNGIRKPRQWRVGGYRR